jgi:hypothetical protein
MKSVLISVFAALTLLGQVMKLTPEEFVVKPRLARYWRFSVSGNMGHVMGDFRASGGAHNDIRALITDSDECENYLNGNQANVFFDSGQKTVAKVDVQLNQGRYCLIFDNRNSVVSAKEIASRIFLQNE